MEYKQFLEKKLTIDMPSGFEPDKRISQRKLFPFQEAIVRWACLRGRSAVFADTGLGKTRIQLAWAEQVLEKAGSVLIFAPLCVANQTVKEAEVIGIKAIQLREMPETLEKGIYVTNYELLHHFEEDIIKGTFKGIVLDESSILKHETSKTRQKIIEITCRAPYKMSCTATPSPNDFMELGNQAEFLGVMDLSEVLAMFFTHDGGETSKWRLKGHGKERFWEWLSQWAVCIRMPSDIGYNDDGYELPTLIIKEHIVKTGTWRSRAETLIERNRARRETISERVKRCAEMVNGNKEQWIVWCHLNDESSQLAKAIPDAVEVRGSDKRETKEERIMAFTEGKARVLITKPSIAGFGMNWQHCHNVAFVGLNDSYEQLYQAIRRCWRFGQEKEVMVHLISADIEGKVLENIKRKESQNEEMRSSMVGHMRKFSKKTITQLAREKAEYKRDFVKGDGWVLHLGDSVEVLREKSAGSIDYSIFSPPFSSLYTYSNSDRDMGNCKTYEEFWEHFRYLIKELHRVIKDGRLVSVHCMNLPISKFRHGYIGIRDFRGEIIKEFQAEGFIYHSEVCIWKNPVTAMHRTKALGLLWKQIKKDSAMSRQGIPDYVVTFRKDGENPKPISWTAEEFPVDEWQQLASPIWMNIDQSNTLNRSDAREEEDERHVCPLQIEVIQRCIRLWSKPGDVVLSPFAGIGSEVYVATVMGRKGMGIELKPSYYELAKRNLMAAKRDKRWDSINFKPSGPHIVPGQNQQELTAFSGAN